jgi:sulfide dehydrogenase cytochrome subunit
LAILGLAVAGAAHAGGIEGLARTCNNCHGVDGVSAGGTMPSIGGQPEQFLNKVMLEWKRGERAAATMNRLIRGYSDEQIAALAKYYAGKPWKPQVQAAKADVLAKGKDATERCENCHGVSGSEPNDDETPRLHGQWVEYMELEMDKYRDEAFQVTHRKMRNSALKMEADEVAPAVQYYGAQAK